MWSGEKPRHPGELQAMCTTGVTEEFVGAPIRSSMETVTVDKTPQGIPVRFDRHAYGADHVVVAGRIKPHSRSGGQEPIRARSHLSTIARGPSAVPPPWLPVAGTMNGASARR